MPAIEILNLLESLTKKKNSNQFLFSYLFKILFCNLFPHTHTHVEDALLFLSMLTYPFPP